MNNSGIKRIKDGVQVEFNGSKKIFTHKPIFFPNQYKQAKETYLVGNDVIVIGMNGYSLLTDQTCREWGVRPGAYEAACERLLRDIISHLWEVFPGVDIRLVHGASNMGIDNVIMRVAGNDGLNITQLGHSCPEFMMYVEDDDVPVYVAKNKEAYADAFINSLDILIAANGRAHAFVHDIDAAFKKLKYVIPVNILKAISTNGGPPAMDRDGNIEDAVAAFEERVFMVSAQLGQTPKQSWQHINTTIRNTMEEIVRSQISPRRAFGL